MEGREASESEGEEQVGAEGVAEADAMRAALGDGAQVVSEADAMVGVRGQAAGASHRCGVIIQLPSASLHVSDLLS
jgi:hypothetical protein